MIDNVGLARRGASSALVPARCGAGSNRPSTTSVAKMMKVEMKDLGAADVQAHKDEDLKKAITDGQGKMSKSLGNAICFGDGLDAIAAKV